MTRENVASHLQKYRMHLKMMGAANNMSPEEMMQLHVNGEPGSEAVDRRWKESENASRGGGGSAALQRWPSGGFPLDSAPQAVVSRGVTTSSHAAPSRASTAPQLWVPSSKPAASLAGASVLPGVVRSLASMAAAQQSLAKANEAATEAANATAAVPPLLPLVAQQASALQQAAASIQLYGSIDRAVAAAAAGLPIGGSALPLSASSLLTLLPSLAAAGASTVGGAPGSGGAPAASTPEGRSDPSSVAGAALGGAGLQLQAGLQLPVIYSLPAGAMILGGSSAAGVSPPAVS